MASSISVPAQELKNSRVFTHMIGLNANSATNTQYPVELGEIKSNPGFVPKVIVVRAKLLTNIHGYDVTPAALTGSVLLSMPSLFINNSTNPHHMALSLNTWETVVIDRRKAQAYDTNHKYTIALVQDHTGIIFTPTQNVPSSSPAAPIAERVRIFLEIEYRN